MLRVLMCTGIYRGKIYAVLCENARIVWVLLCTNTHTNVKALTVLTFPCRSILPGIYRVRALRAVKIPNNAQDNTTRPLRRIPEFPNRISRQIGRRVQTYAEQCAYRSISISTTRSFRRHTILLVYMLSISSLISEKTGLENPPSAGRVSLPFVIRVLVCQIYITSKQ